MPFYADSGKELLVESFRLLLEEDMAGLVSAQVPLCFRDGCGSGTSDSACTYLAEGTSAISWFGGHLREESRTGCGPDGGRDPLRLSPCPQILPFAVRSCRVASVSLQEILYQHYQAVLPWFHHHIFYKGL